MPYSYRITKYDKVNSEGYLTSPPEEWTSFHEIDTPEKEKDYVEIESRYLNAIRTISECMNIAQYKVSELESHDSEDFFEGQEINVSDIENIARQILREQIWCKLISPNGEFHFGYDYYMYFLSNKCAPSCISALSNNLTIQEYLSPYA
ncbi:MULTISPECIES: hypothetical protein [unclassified Pseudomonas]|uniref:hypothetical protein n=1 Tax=unclassified Pseudomonas TaxID=196821 RepID=UPI0030D76E7D